MESMAKACALVGKIVVAFLSLLGYLMAAGGLGKLFRECDKHRRAEVCGLLFGPHWWTICLEGLLLVGIGILSWRSRLRKSRFTVLALLVLATARMMNDVDKGLHTKLEDITLRDYYLGYNPLLARNTLTNSYLYDGFKKPAFRSYVGGLILLCMINLGMVIGLGTDESLVEVERTIENWVKARFVVQGGAPAAGNPPAAAYPGSQPYPVPQGPSAPQGHLEPQVYAAPQGPPGTYVYSVHPVPADAPPPMASLAPMGASQPTAPQGHQGPPEATYQVAPASYGAGKGELH